MKAFPLLAVVLGAVIAGLAIVVGAPPYISEPVRVLLGLGYGAALAIVLHGPIGKAIGQQIQGGAAPDDRVLAQLDEISADLQALRDDMAQLNERMDFTERVLARERPAERLGGGA